MALAPYQDGGQPIITGPVDKASTELQGFARRHLRGPVPRESKVGVGRPVEEILRLAREEGVNLIVMGTHVPVCATSCSRVWRRRSPGMRLVPSSPFDAKAKPLPERSVNNLHSHEGSHATATTNHLP